MEVIYTNINKDLKLTYFNSKQLK